MSPPPGRQARGGRHKCGESLVDLNMLDLAKPHSITFVGSDGMYDNSDVGSIDGDSDDAAFDLASEKGIVAACAQGSFLQEANLVTVECNAGEKLIFSSWLQPFDVAGLCCAWYGDARAPWSQMYGVTCTEKVKQLLRHRHVIATSSKYFVDTAPGYRKLLLVQVRADLIHCISKTANKQQRTRCSKRITRHLWVQQDAERKTQEKTEAARRAARLAAMERTQAILNSSPFEGCMQVGPPLALHVEAAASQLRKLQAKQRPSRMDALASFLKRRGCCKAMVQVPVGEFAAMLMTLLDRVDGTEALRNLLARFSGVSSGSDLRYACAAAERSARIDVAKDPDALVALERQEFARWIKSRAVAHACVEPLVLAAELTRRGIALPAIDGHIDYAEDMLAAAAHPTPVSAKRESLEVVLPLGFGRLGAMRAKLLRLGNLSLLASRWEAAALNTAGAVVTGFTKATIENSKQGLELKLQTILSGTSRARDSFYVKLKKAAQDDIAQMYSPPCFACRSIPAAALGSVIGRRGVRVWMIERCYGVTLEFEMRIGTQVHGRAWITPSLFDMGACPDGLDACIARLRDSVPSVCTAVNEALSRRLCDQVLLEKYHWERLQERNFEMASCHVENDELAKPDLERKRTLDRVRRERAVRRQAFKFKEADHFADQGRPRGGRFKQGEKQIESGVEISDLVEM